MQGQMQSYPLTLVHPFERAERLFADKPIVSATPAGIERTTYGAWAERTRKLGGVLDALGISADGRVGTFAWNSARHLELYFAAPCTGRVLHTLNIRLFPEQLQFVADHAEDEVIFADRSLLKLLWPLIDDLPVGEARRGHGRRRAGRDPRRRAHPRLRDAARRGRPGRVPRRRREQRRGHVLHERHHGQPEGRRLLAPLERPALHELDVRRHARGLGGRRDPAGRADVPRQRVGARAGRRARRLDVRDARPGPVAAGGGGSDGVREGDLRRRRADDLDGRARRARRARPVVADADPVRRLGRPEVALGGLPARRSACR